MKLIRIGTYYPSYLKQFYSHNLQLEDETYSAQHQLLMADCFLWADFWTHAFEKLGYLVWEVVGNAEAMQKAWARENGVSYSETTWLTDIVMAQTKHFQPDIVFVADCYTYSASFLDYLRSECSSIKLVMGWCGAPYSDGSVFNSYDLVLSNIPNLVKDFQDKGHTCQYIRHAFDPRILDRINYKSVKKTDFSFVGSIIKYANFHNQREALLKKLLEKTELQIWSHVSQPSKYERQSLPLRQTVYDFAQIANSLPGGRWLMMAIPKIRSYSKLKQRPNLSHYVDNKIAASSNPPLFGLSMYQKLYESRITLNTHIDISGQFASNMRLYEATGVGTCLLTDCKQNLHELFEPDVEVVTYRDAEEAVEKVCYLLDHNDERLKIANSGQQRTLKSHTYEIRAKQLDRIIHSII